MSKKLAIEKGKLGIKSEVLDSGLLTVDFFSSRFLHRIKTTHHKSDIAKACSLKCWADKDGGPSLKVLDLTAGLGTDAVMLAYLGAEVTLIERQPEVYQILEDALRRAEENFEASHTSSQLHEAICQRVNLMPRQDSYDFLEGIDEGVFDCIYFDPMFPERKKAAKVKLAMQVFHQIVGLDINQEERILDLAILKAKKRVVVKRSKQSIFMAGRKPSYSLTLKALRYDIYLNKP